MIFVFYKKIIQKILFLILSMASCYTVVSCKITDFNPNFIRAYTVAEPSDFSF